MDPITQQTVTAAAGAGGGDPLYVDDVFSTYLYDGTGSAQTITNGIDISGEGGLVWIKNRESGTQDNVLNDTERGAGQIIESNNTNAQFLSTARFSAFNSNGFTVGTDNATNQSGNGIVSWTFRKAPGFFDVVTYTGNQTARTISHSLGSVPGMIIIKRYSDTGYWRVYHRSTGAGQALELNSTSVANNETYWNSTSPTSSVFSLSSETDINKTGETYVAYIFAHDDAQFGTDGDESIIKCDNYVGGGSASPTTVNLGFEPQWVLIKNVDTASEWMLFDSMRGITTDGLDNYLSPNANVVEADGGLDQINLTSTGFEAVRNSQEINALYANYIYIAIRRPHKPPEVGTEVFKATNLVAGPVSLGFVPDLNISKYTAGVQSWFWLDRLRGGSANLFSDSTAAEGGGVGINFDETTNSISGQGYGTLYANWAFKRAPGFFDVVAYTGDGTAGRTVPHNLGVAPELIIVKNRTYSSGTNWIVWCNQLTRVTEEPFMSLNATNGKLENNAYWNNGAHTASVFETGSNLSVNGSGDGHIAYLFATLPGISKVGSYTGTGSPINIDCGFTNGARFVLIKRTDAAGGWYLWDTTRGIVSGNDPYLRFDVTGAQTTSTDHVDPLNAGFIVNANETDLNASGGTYIFLAIA